MGGRLAPDALQAVCRRVYRKYPAVDGVRPRVTPQEARGKEQFLVQFRTTARLDDGKKLPITVRAVVNDSGKILKLSSSR